MDADILNFICELCRLFFFWPAFEYYTQNADRRKIKKKIWTTFDRAALGEWMGRMGYVELAASRKCFLPHEHKLVDEEPEGMWPFRLSARTWSREAPIALLGEYVSNDTSHTSEEDLECTWIFIIIIIMTTLTIQS